MKETQFIIYSENYDRIQNDNNLHTLEKNKALFSLFTNIFEELSSHVDIRFTTLFSRCTYVINTQNFNSLSKYYVHTYRRLNEKQSINNDNVTEVYQLGLQTVNSLIDLFKDEKTEILLSDELTEIYAPSYSEVFNFKPFVRGVAIDHDDENSIISFVDVEGNEMSVHYDIGESNEIFTSSIHGALQLYDFPFHINLIDVEFSDDKNCIPKGFVIEPDFLVDVTSVSESFINDSIESRLTLLRRFNKVDSAAKPLLLGNVANMFFDRILSNPSITFNEIIPEIFKINPLGIALYDNPKTVELVNEAKIHFDNLVKVIHLEFPRINLERENIFLEPSFYSMKYGLQGRLDLLHLDAENKRYDIVELKSGKPFRPNSYGLSLNHYIQTLLYDLMIKSTFGSHVKPNNYILYSKIDESLKYAPSIKSQQYEAMRARNEIILIDKYMSMDWAAAKKIVESIHPDLYPHIKGYLINDIKKFSKVIQSLNPIEKQYFYEFLSFMIREQRYAKVGEHGQYKDNGLAALWLENWEEKENRFSLLRSLRILENHSKELSPIVVLEKSEHTNDLANFRVGDVTVLYPYIDSTEAVLENQIFKCSIVDISARSISVKLRSQQYNDDVFNRYEYWSLEQDSLDSSFNASYRSLFSFAKAKSKKRDLLLGYSAPRFKEISVEEDPSLTEEQNQLIEAMLSAEDYYLLWGPPGTGKTSRMIKRVAEYLYQNTEEYFILLAYTNRAVDEICDALESIQAEEPIDYIRIGSSTGCGEHYRDKLLNQQISGVTSRQGIVEKVKGNRIYVGTVSSVLGKSELFELIKFDRVIIDEASQILEPLMMGILADVDKFILIGDHKQLPAVVRQDDDKTKVVNKELHDQGITNMSMSFFERLFHQCQDKNWQQAIGLLSQQGRMHRDLMKFPNDHFYNGSLRLLEKLDRLHAPDFFHDTQKEVFKERFVYIPTSTVDSLNWKTNMDEVTKITQIVKSIFEEYDTNDKSIDNESIGIIAPYRAQVALIKKTIEGIDDVRRSLISVDTVERYQGSSRDIIILSLCTNNTLQFQNMVSLSSEGIDRKLNVATTRCKEHLIVLGNEEIMRTNPVYHALIEDANQVDL